MFYISDQGVKKKKTFSEAREKKILPKNVATKLEGGGGFFVAPLTERKFIKIYMAMQMNFVSDKSCTFFLTRCNIKLDKAY